MSKITERYIDFIGMYDNVFADGFCETIIESADKLQKDGLCRTRKQVENANKTIKDDLHFFLNLFNHGGSLRDFNGQDSFGILLEGLQDCFDRYCNEYDVLNHSKLTCDTYKLQITKPGSGYHVWHAEQSSNTQKNRCLVYSLYLNTIEEAGETEFLYQKLRIPSKKNTCVIWPAAFTHAHRGNVVHGDTSKYIITGWFYYD